MVRDGRPLSGAAKEERGIDIGGGVGREKTTSTGVQEKKSGALEVNHHWRKTATRTKRKKAMEGRDCAPAGRGGYGPVTGGRKGRVRQRDSGRARTSIKKMGGLLNRSGGLYLRELWGKKGLQPHERGQPLWTIGGGLSSESYGDRNDPRRFGREEKKLQWYTTLDY